MRRYSMHINEDNRQTVLCTDESMKELLKTLRYFREQFPDVPVKITDDTGFVLIDEARYLSQHQAE